MCPAVSLVPKIVCVGTERTIVRMASEIWHPIGDPEALARKLKIVYETTKKALAATTQSAAGTASVLSYRRYRTDQRSLC